MNFNKKDSDENEIIIAKLRSKNVMVSNLISNIDTYSTESNFIASTLRNQYGFTYAPHIYIPTDILLGKEVPIFSKKKTITTTSIDETDELILNVSKKSSIV
jgi:hypothetical protein